MKKNKISILFICILLLIIISFISFNKHRFYGDTKQDIINVLSDLYESTVDVVDTIEIDNTKIVAFITNGNTGVATFIKNNSRHYVMSESMHGRSEFIVNYGYIDSKRMCVAIANNQNISTILFKKNGVVAKTWDVNSTSPLMVYYNDESIQNESFEFEFIFLDKDGNKI